MPEIPLEISVENVKAKLDAGDDFLLVDCREPDEYAVAKIEAALLVPMSEIQKRVDELPSDRPIVVHCHHGGRSLRVVQWLRQREFPGAQSMAGGIDAWSQQIDPAVPRY